MLGELFVEVLALCREAGLVQVGEIAIDGTKIRANASRDRNRSYESIVSEIFDEAERIDREEDALYGEARGDELPEQLRTREGRLAPLKAAREKLQAEREAKRDAGEEVVEAVALELDPEHFVTRQMGRRAWLRDGRRVLDQQRERDAAPIPQPRAERLLEIKRRFDEELAFEHAANRCYEAYRAGGRMKDGRRFGRPPDAVELGLVPQGRTNITDPDSRVMRTHGQPVVQGYNAQAAVTEGQIIVAAEVTIDSPDFGHFEPMVKATLRDLDRAGVSDRPTTMLADAGYWHKDQIEAVVADGIQVLIPPDGGLRQGTRPGWDGGLYAFMRRVLASPAREGALRHPQTRRAGVRADQTQPRAATASNDRQSRRPRGMATYRRHPQPPQAPPATGSQLPPEPLLLIRPAVTDLGRVSPSVTVTTLPDSLRQKDQRDLPPPRTTVRPSERQSRRHCWFRRRSVAAGL